MGAGASAKRHGAKYAVKAETETKPVAEQTGKDVDGVWDDITSFENHLCHGATVAAMQLFAALFAEAGLGDAVDIKVEATILQQVSIIHLPTASLLEALVEEEQGPCARAAVLGGEGEALGADPAMLQVVPPDFSKISGLAQQSFRDAMQKTNGVLQKSMGVDYRSLKQTLQVLGSDGLDSLRKVDNVIQCINRLVGNTQNTVSQVKSLVAKSKILQDDIAKLEEFKLSIVTFFRHLEATFTSAKTLMLALQQERDATEALGEAAKALIVSLEKLVKDLKVAGSETASGLEEQLSVLKELPVLVAEAAIDGRVALNHLSAFAENMGSCTTQACEDAFQKLAARLQGEFCDSVAQSVIRKALTSAITGMIRDAVKVVALKVLALAAHVSEGEVKEKVGFSFGSFLSLQFTIAADLSKVHAAMTTMQADLEATPFPDVAE